MPVTGDQIGFACILAVGFFAFAKSSGMATLTASPAALAAGACVVGYSAADNYLVALRVSGG